MCTTCGCGTDQVTIDGKAHAHGHDHDHAHGHDHDHDHAHHHHHGAEHSHAAGVGADRAAAVETAILAKNDAEANANRREFTARGILALNLVSSPGSGKTTLLVETIKRLGGDLPIAVIEGDQQTSNDAERIRATGSKAVQVNTGKGCHLDAHMVGHAFEALAPAPDSVLMIENVGNLVCPAAFDLGEAHKV
ncbi:MAG: hydrogenase nickel incorporation protein HypB, partial [Burkholderiales bacterium]|nr:hydrogenase nickel incorporation protein HypB [Burkholderiales bacterium]